MASVFITGSSDGPGLMIGRHLAEQGHKIVLHARQTRARRCALPHRDEKTIAA
jgi:NAD(P)-dependent dehydrogenase (short-subunit alcohol dehydrogenase family)